MNDFKRFDAMWESEKRTHEFAARLWKQRDDARGVLQAAKQKLMLYRAQHSGEYVGGMEYTQLMRMIDEVLNG
jgi:hypothetical protein